MVFFSFYLLYCSSVHFISNTRIFCIAYFVWEKRNRQHYSMHKGIIIKHRRSFWWYFYKQVHMQLNCHSASVWVCLLPAWKKGTNSRLEIIICQIAYFSLGIITSHAKSKAGNNFFSGTENYSLDKDVCLIWLDFHDFFYRGGASEPMTTWVHVYIFSDILFYN